MICVSHLTALDAAPENYVTWAAEAGFDGVGLRILPPRHAPDRYPVSGDLARCRDLRRRAEDAGICIYEAESFGIAADTDVICDFSAALDSAAELGASVLIAGGIDTEESRLIANYRHLAEEAEKRGLTLGIEFMPTRPMATLQDALRVQKAVDHPAAKLLIDTLHLARSGNTPDEVGQIDPARIGYIHVTDGVAVHPGAENLPRESRSGRLYPGEGELPLRELFARLPAGIPVSLEAPHRDQQNLPPRERLLLAGTTTRAFFSGLSGCHS